MFAERFGAAGFGQTPVTLAAMVQKGRYSEPDRAPSARAQKDASQDAPSSAAIVGL